MTAAPNAIYAAWTERFDAWFAAPGVISMDARPGAPYWFETSHEGQRHPHYGRFLRVEPDRLIEQTWVTGREGTGGAETVVRVELTDSAVGTRMRLTHEGFYDKTSARQHADSWPRILEHLDQWLSGSG
jgi:uncharacterized protein YndB with AHSA1/START domain